MAGDVSPVAMFLLDFPPAAMKIRMFIHIQIQQKTTKIWKNTEKTQNTKTTKI